MTLSLSMETTPKNYKRFTWLNGLKVLILIAIPLTLLILPLDFFDEGKSISLFALLGLEDYVYSTGMTRAVMHLMHFDFAGAREFNILSFFVLPLLFVLWLKWLLAEFGISILRKF